MVEIVMIKRAAARAGEIGLFVNAAPFEDDFAAIKMDGEVQVKATTPRSLRQHKFAWALASKISDACDWLETKDDAMEYLLIEAKHFRRIYDPLRKIAHLRPKPTNWGAMDGTEYTRLLKRMTHVAITQVCPGLEDAALRAEIEAMIGPDIAPEPEAPKQRRTRAAKPSLAEGQPQREEVVSREVNSDTSSASNGDGAPADPPSHGDRSEPPANEAEYIAACRGWIQKQTASHENARQYFEGEHHVALRQKCKVGIGTRNLLRRELAESYEQKASQ